MAHHGFSSEGWISLDWQLTVGTETLGKEPVLVINLLMGSEPEGGLVHLHICSETSIVPWVTGVSYRAGREECN